MSNWEIVRPLFWPVVELSASAIIADGMKAPRWLIVMFWGCSVLVVLFGVLCVVLNAQGRLR